jgi:hypothetical protein
MLDKFKTLPISSEVQIESIHNTKDSILPRPAWDNQIAYLRILDLLGNRG